MSRSLLRALAVYLLSVAGMVPGAQAASERTFAVVPQQAPTRLATHWQPLLDALSKRTGIHFHFVTAPNIAEFERRVLAGKYDYVYLNAVLYRDAHRKAGFRVLVRKKPDLHGIIVVRRDGPQSLGALRDQTIAFPAPHAFGATLLNRAELKKRHIDHRVAFLGTHESVYRAVAQGQFVAGGGVQRSFKVLPDAVRDQLRILYRSKAAPSHAIAAARSIYPDERRRVQTALLQIGNEPEGRKLLAALDIEGFRLNTASDTRRVRASGITRRARAQKMEFHVIPRLNRADTERQMEPLAAYFKQRLEIRIELHTYNNMAAFESAIYHENRPALVNANPLQAVRLVREGYSIIAQQVPVMSPEGMHSIILTREDSSIHALADLRGKRIAFGGGPTAFFASMVPRAMLQQAGLKGKYEDVSKPGPVSQAIARLRRGDIDAAGCGTLALHSEGLKRRYGVDRMRVIARSEAMPGLAWLVSPGVSPSVRVEIQHLLLGYDRRSPGHSALTAGGIAGLRPASRKDYAVVERYVRELKEP
jgi:phosphonate transport system substrate-binding protein